MHSAALFGRVAPGKTCVMSDWIDSEGYRANVGIVLMRDSGEVFLGQRTGGRGWQFPQGGVRQGEPVEQALYRELQEEIGLDARARDAGGVRRPTGSDTACRSATCAVGAGPPASGRSSAGSCCASRCPKPPLNSVSRIPAEPEFDGWRWANYWEPVREVIYFKRPVYVRMLTELAPTAFPGGPPPLPEWWQTEVAATAED